MIISALRYILPSIVCSSPCPCQVSTASGKKTPEAVHNSNNLHNETIVTRPRMRTRSQMYFEALKGRANEKGLVILVSTDYGVIDMAVNLYITSFKRLNISNYLFVSSDSQASRTLKEKDIAHFTYHSDGKDGKTVSNYGTAAFRKKTHIKTEIILEALKLGFTVLITDVDIVFIENPLPHLDCSDCDIQIQNDEVESNSGFYLARPTTACITLHRTALNMAVKSSWLSNQKTIDRTMEQMVRQGMIKRKILSLQQFPNGRIYFETGHRMFADNYPCKSCLIVHNNWITSGAAKEYRFKENLMWLYDKDKYYSDTNAKYLIYDNPFDFGTLTTTIEIEALKAALTIGHLLKRIVILPMFHCYGCKYEFCKAFFNKPHRNEPHCSLNTHIRISDFNKAFPNAYRERVFLWHNYIPNKVRTSKSPTILIRTRLVMSQLRTEEMKHIKLQFTPRDTAFGASSTEIIQWLRPLSSFKVLRFHSMYRAFGYFHRQHADVAFSSALKTGIHKADYRQY